MGLIKLLINDPVTFLLLTIPLLYSVIVHELAHGWVALVMGDNTAKRLGRLSLNPLKHLDPLGTLMLFIVGFGWAKPVPVNLQNISSRRTGFVLVSAAGVVANTIFAFVAILLTQILMPPPQSPMATFLFYLAQINIILAAFNLIPIPPLDGSKIVMGLLPDHIRHIFQRMEPYGFFIIIIMLYLGVLTPVIVFFRRMILGVIGFFL
ncbi:MAG: site-2 protease family protein [Syntrophales bacterium]|jgi:Zn-dependent protease|nr:site-2 protease family protein [Syntrophales bacterium]NLN59168.1 site-2 protease family protein [Deltaproteobacteria bacterium]